LTLLCKIAYELGDPMIDSRQEQEIFVFFAKSGPTLMYTQPNWPLSTTIWWQV